MTAQVANVYGGSSDASRGAWCTPKWIAEKVGASDSGDPDVAALEEATRPENLAGQLERAQDAVDAVATESHPA